MNEELKTLSQAIKTGWFNKCQAYAPAAHELCVINE